ncbi:MAG: hypothetical protein IK139_04920 [Lachnospiraceae bacterium]|nr:hypothetical protein [Lachnospiraceae bacterium]
MEKRIKKYLIYLESVKLQELSEDELKLLKNELLTQISFFSHERLIHLLVTLFFALFTVISIVAFVFTSYPGMGILALLFLVLLVPYIRHYYILENSVQKMYGFYDRITLALSPDRENIIFIM